MIKNLLYVFIGAIVLSSCTLGQLTKEPPPEAINFGSFVSNATKASSMTDALLKTSGFTTYAYSTGAQAWALRGKADVFMDNKPVIWDAINSPLAWSYTPVMFWPGLADGITMGKVSFFAYAPTSATGTSVSTVTAPSALHDGNELSLLYTCPAANDEQIDLLAASSIDKDQNTGNVSFAFKHILSKIGFSAQLEEYYEGATIVLTSLSISHGDANILKEGTYTYSNTELAGVWSTNPSAFLATNNGSEIIAGGDIALGNTIQSPQAVSQLNTGDTYFMFIPQAVDSGDLIATLTYTLTSGEGSNESTETVVRVIPLPGITWDMSKQYIYNLKISLIGVVFDTITVIAWDDVSPKNILDIITVPNWDINPPFEDVVGT